MRRMGWLVVVVAALAPAAFFACSDEPSPKGAWVDAYVEPPTEPEEPEEPQTPADASDASDASDSDAKADGDASQADGDADAAG